ncbi:phosphoadenylyl-sulfate reductase [Stakelama sediminis]|uniref:Adenosine 5'-phosphosulfate reductase n=1 Tax=Stakelama sediminis TaxID=463200 RepID=A0A840YZB6_9SPHN|nr:phosphoadenylyl-sulfate reductase [Stakelama sediminis]MBB5718844.1 phosphoadenosine phosphosulfate reductase [Stakelama sediminis]
MADTALRKIDRLDVRPRFTVTDVHRLNNLFRGTDTMEMLRTVIGEQMAGDVATVSSFGTESAVLLHLIASVDASLPVLFLDTGKHFPETIAYRDTLTAFLGLKDVRILSPDAEALKQRDETGLRWSYDPDGCCEIRKVVPLEKALAGFDASFTGRKAFQASTRNALPRFELDGDRLKINPLIDWTREDIAAWFDKHDLPHHPLETEGYPSIGCAPCTSKVLPGEDPRSGRWRGWDKTECGIHTPVADGDPDQPSF